MSVDFTDKLICLQSFKFDEEWLNVDDEHDDEIPEEVLHCRFKKEQVFENLSCLWKVNDDNKGNVTIENMEYRNYYLYASDIRDKKKCKVVLRKLSLNDRGKWKFEPENEGDKSNDRENCFYLRNVYTTNLLQPHKTGIAKHGPSKKLKNSWCIHPVTVVKKEEIINEIKNLTSEQITVGISAKVGVFNRDGSIVIASEDLARTISKLFENIDKSISYSISQLEGESEKTYEQYMTVKPNRKLTAIQITGLYGPFIIRTNNIDFKLEMIE